MRVTVNVKHNPNLDVYYSTVNLHVDYLASARDGATVIASSNITKPGNRIMYVEGWLHDDSGKLLAHSTCNMLKVERRT
jgi:acyl-coenzyme A thioesterase PaaI-like protein